MTPQEFVAQVARMMTVQELDKDGCQDIAQDCMETIDSLVEQAREMTATPQPESPKPAWRWTAGPWETGDRRWPNCIVSQRGAPGALGLVRVAEVHYATPEDLALMTAAPELASACQRALALIGPDGSKELTEWESTIDALESALRKAGAL